MKTMAAAEREARSAVRDRKKIWRQGMKEISGFNGMSQLQLEGGG